MQYIAGLEASGVNVIVMPFFDDQYLKDFYRGKKGKVGLIHYFLRRLSVLKKNTQVDLIWVEKEALPWIPWCIERYAFPRGIPIISDYDDAVFHRYDKSSSAAVRYVLGNKIAKVMKYSTLVVVGNRYLRDYASFSGAENIEVIPTVVDLNAYEVAGREEVARTLRVGWIGTPHTWLELARPTHALLMETLRKSDAIFSAVGASMDASRDGSLEIIPWSEGKEVELIQQMTIGLMPLPETPWARGKCGYKLIQYMACGIPVVASPVGANKDIVDHGVNGFLASTDEEWVDAVGTLLADEKLRREMGAAGRRKVEKHYSLQAWTPKLLAFVKSLQ
ncbi:glycosyltransferase family 4 protein [bacterium]|nr:glycosyltransferase family 4 protein [bacterium]